MGLSKGHTNNPNGRPKGVKTKRIEQWELLGDFITIEGAERAITILKGLKDEDFLDQYYKLLSYFKPKLVMQSIDMPENDLTITVKRQKDDGSF